VPTLEKGIEFYVNKLGHEIIWKTPSAIGLKLPDSKSEIVIHTEAKQGVEIDFKVEDVGDSCSEYVSAGGKILVPPFDIAIGKCCVVEDPFGNIYVVLDSSKGVYQTDSSKEVIGLKK
jgi:hypothetical protein